MGWLAMILRWTAGGGANALVGQWSDLQKAKLDAGNDAARLELEREQGRVEAMLRTADQAVSDRWSATSLGRYLIVLPYGIWWASIFLVSTFNIEGWTVLAVPHNIEQQANWMVPVIVIGDIGQTVAKRFGKRT